MANRRTFLAMASSAGVAALPFGRALAQPHDPRHGMMIVNSLGFPQDPYAPHTAPIADDAATAAAHASGLTAVNVTVSSTDDFAGTIKAIEDYDAFVQAHSTDYLKVLTAADIRRAKAENKIGFIYGFQNAAMVGDKPERIDTFAEMGVRVIQLTYNAPNQLGGGSLAPGDPGLTPFGHQIVERLNARRVIVDLSHSGHQICLDAARASAQPICITHTGCAALVASPRNKTDQELRLVAEKGGYVGIYFMPYLNPGRPFSSEDVADHIDHAIKICGEDHVGIGSDHGVNELGDLEVVRAHYGKMVALRRTQGISVKGEDETLLPYGTDLMGPNQLHVIADRLAKRGYASSRVEKIMGLNFLRYCQDIWGA